MIQIQNSRFAYNWKHHPGSEKAYPGYEVLLPEFEDGLNKFTAFAAEADLGRLDLNQWEVIYVNHIPKGDLWQTVLLGALFGFISYATYDLTNLATLKDWPLQVTFIDLAWGTFLGASTSTVAHLLYRLIF